MALVIIVLGTIPVACTPSPQMNVMGYLLADRLGTLQPADPNGPKGSLTGMVTDGTAPIAGATVLVAERTGRAHSAQTDQAGLYRIDAIPVGQYVPAAIAPGYHERAASDAFGIPRLATVSAEAVTEVPPLILLPGEESALPSDLARIVGLERTATYTATAPFPEGASAQVQAYRFERDGVLVDTLRTYLPTDLAPEQKLPLIFFSYPGHVDSWEALSVGYASEGFALVALSPAAAHGVDIDEHAADARVALALAREGALALPLDETPTVALGGSFSSAILNRLLRYSDANLGAWVTVGGISDAFAGTEAFYRGELEVPPAYELLIPALGNPQIYPLPFLRFSPIYVAGQLPPTLIIHTAADRIIPIEQAVALAAALDAAGVPVETYTYDDVSHYLQIDDKMTDEARAMYYHVLDFIEQHVGPGPSE